MTRELVEEQKRRIERLASAIDPSWQVEFRFNRLNPDSAALRFKIRDRKSGKILGSIRADYEWDATLVSDKSDAELRGMIAALARPSP
jgi:hypothetical protein